MWKKNNNSQVRKSGKARFFSGNLILLKNIGEKSVNVINFNQILEKS